MPDPHPPAAGRDPEPLFDEATAVRPGAGEGEWEAEVRDELTIVNGHPNGGYLVALMARAALAAEGADDRHVVGATATFVSPPSTGPATVTTAVLRRGRTASQVRTQVVQDGRTTVDGVMTVATLDREPAVWGEQPPVELPDEATCRSASSGRSPLPGQDEPPLAKVLDLAFDPATLGWTTGRPGGGGEMRAWLRLVGDRPWDPLSLLFAVDALPPATFEVAFTGWVPTLSLTAYIRARPAAGPLRARFRTGVITGGLVDETCEVWDSTGRVVAQSTQLAAIRMP